MNPIKSIASWQLPHWLTVLGVAFGTGALDALKTYFTTGGLPSTVPEWESLAQAVVLGGIGAVIAMYRTPPGKVSLELPKKDGGDDPPASVPAPPRVPSFQSKQPPSASRRGFMRHVGVWPSTVGLAWALFAVPGCSQPIFPTLTKIEQTVANDLMTGKTAEQIEADVAVIMCGSAAAPLCIDAVVVVNDTIQFLIDTHVIGDKTALVNAQAILAVEHAKIAARAGAHK